MFCPKCRAEYPEGFAVCADCDVPLIPELPPEPLPECAEFIEILSLLGPSDIAVIKSLLDAEGIDYFIQGEFSYYQTSDVALMVRKDQAEEAKAILKDLKISSPPWR